MYDLARHALVALLLHEMSHVAVTLNCANCSESENVSLPFASPLLRVLPNIAKITFFCRHAESFNLRFLVMSLFNITTNLFGEANSLECDYS